MRESWNAAWIRRCASPACRASTTTEMLSSELPCAMATTLILAAASAEKTPAAMPGVPCMPRPTTATVAMPVLTSTPSISPRPISPANSRSRLSRASVAEGLGHAEADRMLGRRLRDQRDRDLPRVQRVEGAGRDAGHAEHAAAGDGHERLPAGGGERLDREARAAPPARRPRCRASRDRRTGGRRSGMRRPASGISARGCSTLAP